MTENGDRPKYETFSVGLPVEVQAARRRVEDRIAKVAFRKQTRKQVPKYVLWEKILSALDLASDATLKEIFYDGGT